MKKFFFFIILSLIPLFAIADSVEIDGIYYNLIKKANYAEVAKHPQSYEGNIVIPSTINYEGVEYKVNSIGTRAFDYCLKLKSVSISDNVTSIGEYAFSTCQNLESVSLPNTLAIISKNAFVNCYKLTSITIPNSVTEISSAAFYNCSGLTEINIPEGITIIENNLFFGCSSLKSVVIPNSVTKMKWSVFWHCSSLESITLPEGITYIDSDTFRECTSLTSIIIPNNVTTIGSQAFEGCSALLTVTVGNNLNKIYNQAFAKCSDLKDFYCYAKKTPNTENDIFKDSYIEYATLHVPLSSLESYKATSPWSGFKSIVKIDMPKHTLTYKVDGGVYKEYEIEEDETITPEPAPTKEGYTFSGWSEIPSTMPAHDVTVTGTFSVNKYKLTYIIDDKVYKETMYEYGATITPEAQPEGDYTTFEWTNLPQTMPAHDVVVYASYTSGINEVLMKMQHNIRIYSPNGKRLDKMQKGMNIVVLDNATVKKILIK